MGQCAIICQVSVAIYQNKLSFVPRIRQFIEKVQDILYMYNLHIASASSSINMWNVSLYKV
jgi:hypothetical protein